MPDIWKGEFQTEKYCICILIVRWNGTKVISDNLTICILLCFFLSKKFTLKTTRRKKNWGQIQWRFKNEKYHKNIVRILDFMRLLPNIPRKRLLLWLYKFKCNHFTLAKRLIFTSSMRSTVMSALNLLKQNAENGNDVVIWIYSNRAFGNQSQISTKIRNCIFQRQQWHNYIKTLISFCTHKFKVIPHTNTQKTNNYNELLYRSI